MNKAKIQKVASNVGAAVKEGGVISIGYNEHIVVIDQCSFQELTRGLLR